MGSPPAAEPVFVVAVQRSGLVVVVRVVGAQLGGLIDHPVQYRRPGVGVLDERHQAGPGDTAQVTVSFRLVERISRCPRELQSGPCRLQGIAELIPGPAADYPLVGGIILRTAAQLPGENR